MHLELGRSLFEASRSLRHLVYMGTGQAPEGTTGYAQLIAGAGDVQQHVEGVAFALAEGGDGNGLAIGLAFWPQSFAYHRQLPTLVASSLAVSFISLLALRTLQDANNLRVAALEQQVLQAKQQRDTDAANLNFAIQMRQQATLNLAPFNTNLAQSLGSYRLP